MFTDYYDSAEGITITKRRALQELAAHCCENVEDFYNDMGDRETYDAQAVLSWLGY